MEPDTRLIERSRYYLGRARISLEQLLVDEYECGRTFDLKNVSRLIKIFENEGCQNDDPVHCVAAKIALTELDAALEASGETRDFLLRTHDFPTLQLPAATRLEVLHGHHRLRAANEHLYPDRKWWLVDLYDEALPDASARIVREAYLNELRFCDGDIYRNLRYHQLRGSDDAGRWLARLSESKRKDCKQLRDSNPTLCAAFDDLLPFIGLWFDFTLGALHRILPLRCQEELLNYLRAIRDQLNDILPGSGALLDPGTVTYIECLTPAYSVADATRIRIGMDTGVIFPLIRDEAHRERVLNALLCVKGRILSLRMFVEDTKYLEPVAKILRGLVPPRSKRSLRTELRHSFHRPRSGRLPFQRAEYLNVESACEADYAWWAAYCQLALFAWRHFPTLSGILPRKDAGQPKPEAPGYKDDMWYRLADLAHQLGFRTSEIINLRRESPDAKLIRRFLAQARPSDYFTIDQLRHDELLDYIEDRLRTMAVQRAVEATNDLTTNGAPVAKDHRCGRPFEGDHSHDKHSMFFETIYQGSTPLIKEHMTSFAMLRDIFIVFYGNFAPLLTPQESSPDNDPPTNSVAEPVPGEPPSHDEQPSQGQDQLFRGQDQPPHHSAASAPAEPPHDEQPSQEQDQSLQPSTASPAPSHPKVEEQRFNDHGQALQPGPSHSTEQRPPPERASIKEESESRKTNVWDRVRIPQVESPEHCAYKILEGLNDVEAKLYIYEPTRNAKEMLQHAYFTNEKAIVELCLVGLANRAWVIFTLPEGGLQGLDTRVETVKLTDAWETLLLRRVLFAFPKASEHAFQDAKSLFLKLIGGLEAKFIPSPCPSAAAS